MKFFNSKKEGNIKVGITPSYEVYNRYEDIWGASGSNNYMFEFPVYSNSTRTLIYTPSESGTYTLRTSYVGDTRIDTYLYIVDPTITDECLFNDDGGGDLQALITTELIAGRTYFLVVSPYNLSVMDKRIRLSIIRND